MNVFHFINSRSIREYLEKIGYAFTPLQALYFIHSSRSATWQERVDAYRELMKEDGDTPLSYTTEYSQINTLGEFLNAYLRDQKYYQKEILHCRRAYYEFHFLNEDGCWEKHRNASTELLEIMETKQIYSCDKYRIVKHSLDRKREITLEYAEDGTLLNVFCEQDPVETFFKTLFVNVPTPFQKGDILKWCGEKGKREANDDVFNEKSGVLALRMLPTWDSEDLKDQGFFDKMGETSDFTADYEFADERLTAYEMESNTDELVLEGYYRLKDGTLYCGKALCYLDYEFCENSLIDPMIKLASDHLCNRLSLDKTLGLFRAISLQEAADEAGKNLLRFQGQILF